MSPLMGNQTGFVGQVIPERVLEKPAFAVTTAEGARTGSTPEELDRSVYRAAAFACLPRLLRMLEPFPWFDKAYSRRSRGRDGDSELYRRQAATLAIGLFTELDRDLRDDQYLREQVRAALIRWQLTLRGDGRPAHRSLRRGLGHAAIVGMVVQLLTESSGFQTETLLDDVARHLEWLIRRPPQSSWLEAELICAMAEGALLVRDPSLLTRARARLHDLLARQDEEGWFPERGGADPGRLSLTLDALACAYRQNNWAELAGPLQRACRFMLHFVHPDGSYGGCYSSCGTGFLSPYGVELLAPEFAEAAVLATVARRRCIRFANERFPAWHDDLYAVMGPRLVLAATAAPSQLPDDVSLPHEVVGRTHFANAGLSVFVTDAYQAIVGGRQMSALHVTWRNGEPALDDPGVTVVYPRKFRTSCGRHRHDHTQVTAQAVTVQGVLENSGDKSRRWRRLFAGFAHRSKWTSGGKNPVSMVRAKGSPPPDCRRLARDWYRREIVFQEDAIRIRDVVRCRLPCQAVVCQASLPEDNEGLVDRDPAGRVGRPPIIVGGGRSVEIVRVYRHGELIEQQAKPRLMS